MHLLLTYDIFNFHMRRRHYLPLILPPLTENTSGMFSNNKWRIRTFTKAQPSKRSVRKANSPQRTTMTVDRRTQTLTSKNILTYKTSGTEIKMQVSDFRSPPPLYPSYVYLCKSYFVEMCPNYIFSYNFYQDQEMIAYNILNFHQCPIISWFTCTSR